MMAQKRVLVIGAILLAAGIGAPTTAYLAPGGALSGPRTPEVEETAPIEPQADPEGPAAAPSGADDVVQPSVGVTTPPSRPGPKPSRGRVVRPVQPEVADEPGPSPAAEEHTEPPQVIVSIPAGVTTPGPLPADLPDSDYRDTDDR